MNGESHGEKTANRLPMQLETKFLCAHTPVEIGSLFGDWQVCWLGGWGRNRLYYVVMLVKIKREL